jgi:hypothetical protein
MVSQVRRSCRREKPPSKFARRLRATLGVQQSTDQIRGTMAEVKRKLEGLYEDMEVRLPYDKGLVVEEMEYARPCVFDIWDPMRNLFIYRR